MHHFALLVSRSWVTDHGFRKALEANPGIIRFGALEVGPGHSDLVAYWQREKSDYPLWELLCYMGSHTVPQTLAYFELPPDTVPFLRWCYNGVAHQELHRIQEADQSFFGGAEAQLNFFPYEALYTIWQRETEEQRKARRGNVLVYLDRLTEPDGSELLRLRAPGLFE